jgi:hypothetical protein
MMEQVQLNYRKVQQYVRKSTVSKRKTAELIGMFANKNSKIENINNNNTNNNNNNNNNNMYNNSNFIGNFNNDAEIIDNTDYYNNNNVNINNNNNNSIANFAEEKKIASTSSNRRYQYTSAQTSAPPVNIHFIFSSGYSNNTI